MCFKKGFLSFLMIAVLCGAFTACNSTSEIGIINPAVAEKSAVTTDDVQLISLLMNNLHENSMIIMNWINAGVGLEKDEAVTFTPENSDTANYALVTNIPNIKSLKANCELVFSKRFLKSTIYPMLIGGETPLFAENKGKLYYNTNTGGAYAFAPDFSRAKVVSKSKDSFDVEAPITTVDDQEGVPFTYKVVKQGGNWVLDEFYI